MTTTKEIFETSITATTTLPTKGKEAIAVFNQLCEITQPQLPGKKVIVVFLDTENRLSSAANDPCLEERMCCVKMTHLDVNDKTISVKFNDFKYPFTFDKVEVYMATGQQDLLFTVYCKESQITENSIVTFNVPTTDVSTTDVSE